MSDKSMIAEPELTEAQLAEEKRKEKAWQELRASNGTAKYKSPKKAAAARTNLVAARAGKKELAVAKKQAELAEAKRKPRKPVPDDDEEEEGEGEDVSSASDDDGLEELTLVRTRSAPKRKPRVKKVEEPVPEPDLQPPKPARKPRAKPPTIAEKKDSAIEQVRDLIAGALAAKQTKPRKPRAAKKTPVAEEKKEVKKLAFSVIRV